MSQVHCNLFNLYRAIDSLTGLMMIMIVKCEKTIINPEMVAADHKMIISCETIINLRMISHKMIIDSSDLSERIRPMQRIRIINKVIDNTMATIKKISIITRRIIIKNMRRSSYQMLTSFSHSRRLITHVLIVLLLLPLETNYFITYILNVE